MRDKAQRVYFRCFFIFCEQGQRSAHSNHPGQGPHLLHLVQVVRLDSHDRLAELLLDLLHLLPRLLVVHEVDRDALAAEPPGAAFRARQC
jgi:hypothetical protein